MVNCANPQLESPDLVVLIGPNWTEQRDFWECFNINPTLHVVFSLILKNLKFFRRDSSYLAGKSIILQHKENSDYL